MKKTQLTPDNHVNGIYNMIFLLFTYFIHLILILIFYWVAAV